MIYAAAFQWPKGVYAWPMNAPDNVKAGNKNKVKIMHCFDKNSILYPEYNGVTIAYRKLSPYKNCRVVELAVAYCSQYDQFEKKVGARLAMERFNAGKTIVFPIDRPDTDADISFCIENAFWFR